jgi:hypothetical protein
MADLARPQAVYRFWPEGMDSWTAPHAVSRSAYVYGQNVINKGGIPQTRPGSRSLACLPRGNAQGCGIYTPENGVTHLLAAVNGAIFVSPQPFDDWRQLVGLNFNPASKFVTFTECLKTTDYDPDGELFYLNRPYRVVIIQDGNTRAAFWDGSTYQHLNPTPSGQELTVDNRDETKIGLWSTYSNNRYWTARGRFVYASDIGNPLKFSESQYLNEAPAFVLPDDCTGMIESPDQSGILCFYENGADFIQTAIQDRTLWLNTPEFQRKILNVGCIAGRSLVNQHGLIYWFSDRGWISQNEALRANITSTLDPLDDQMAYSKARLGPNLTRIAAGNIENVSLVSVPFCSLKNTHTWCLDSLPLNDQQGSAWASVWTGWQPVCWASGDVDGYERIFFLSSDTDGHNRMWEGFTADRKDNGCDITCFVQFRQEDFNDPLMLKRFRFAEVEFSQLAGTVSAMVTVAGSRGWFDRIMTHDMVATFERVDYEQEYGEGTADYPLLASSRKQSRTVRSQEWVQPSECNQCGIEGNQPVNFDYAFTTWVGWSGRAAITRLNLVASEETENEDRGDCPPDETGPNVVDGGGCSSDELYPVLDEAFPKFFATSIQTGLNTIGDEISWEASAFSQISQKDAQRRADCKAFQQLLINSTLAVGIPELLVYNEAGTELIGDLIDFGYFLLGQTGEITVRLVNVGTGILELSSASVIDAESFEVIDGPGAFSLDPNAFTFITIRFSAVEGEGSADDEVEIVSALTDTTVQGDPYSYQIAALGGPDLFTAQPLPTGLSIDQSTGIISGTPTVVADTAIIITAENTTTGQSDTETLQLSVTLPLAPPYTGQNFNAADYIAVWGFRRLISGYTGNLFTLRRSSDDAEMTFAYDYSPDTLTAWLGGATGFVKEMFDQSGNGRDIDQTTNGLQPQLGFDAPGSYPAMENSTADRHYLQSTGLTLPAGGILTICRMDSGDAGAGLISDDATETPSIRNIFGAIGTWDTFNFPDVRYVDGVATGVFTPGSWQSARMERSAANSTFPADFVVFNAQISLNRTFNGRIAEMLVCDFSDLAAMQADDTTLRTFWGL